MATPKVADEKPATNSDEPGTDVVYPGLSRDQLDEIDTYASAVKLAAIAHGGIVTAEEYQEINKDELVGKPFLIMQFEEGKNNQFEGEGFVIVKGITQDNVKFVFTDGSTGVKRRLERWASEGRFGGIDVPHGLRKSEYGLTADGTPCKLGSPEAKGKGSTYYL